jgi:arylsulfatase A-like enzyme
MNDPVQFRIRFHLVAIAAIVALVLTAAGCRGGAGSRPNLILISIDTLRADHLGAYGYERQTSPVLDRLADESVLFESVISQAPWTLPAHVTMLASLYPSTHQATLDETTIDPAIPTLAAVLKARGYATAAFIDHVFVSSLYGFDRGFDRFDENGGGVAAIRLRASGWLREQRREPFFLFLHLFDVHCPYLPPEGYRELFRSESSRPFDLAGKCGNPDFNSMDLSPGQVAHLIDQYDGGIAHLDAHLGMFFADLEMIGAADRTVLMVTSDHGEEFLEHGQIGHERTVHDEVLRVPWIVRIPDTGAIRIRQTVRLLDLAPTALDLLDLPIPAGFQGRTLVPLVHGDRPEPPPAFAELDRHVRMRSLHRGSFHLIRTGPADPDPPGSASRYQLYDIKVDRGETEDLFVTGTGGAIARGLIPKLEAAERTAVAAGEKYRAGDLEHLDAESRRRLQEKLRSLGYLP